MKYGIFELLEDPEDSEKDLRVLKEEAATRGWEDCKSPDDVRRIVANMINKGFLLVSNDKAGTHGPSGLGDSNRGGTWGRALYFLKKKKADND